MARKERRLTKNAPPPEAGAIVFSPWAAQRADLFVRDGVHSAPLGSGFFLANGAAYDIMALKMRKREKKIRVYLKSGNMTNSEGFFV